jgi:predicted DNA-binding protein (UPF0251 family)
VYDEAFQQCLARYCQLRELEADELKRWWVTIVSTPAGARRIYSNRAIDYVVDFDLIAKRALSRQEWVVMQAYHVRQIPARECARVFGVDEMTVIALAQRAAEKMGRALVLGGLWPVKQYFA